MPSVSLISQRYTRRMLLTIWSSFAIKRLAKFRADRFREVQFRKRPSIFYVALFQMALHLSYVHTPCPWLTFVTCRASSRFVVERGNTIQVAVIQPDVLDDVSSRYPDGPRNA